MYLIAQASYQVNIRIVECLFHAHIRLLLAKDRQELVNITNRFHRLLTWAWFVWGLKPSLLWWLWCLLLLPASWAFNITANYVGRSARCSLKSAPSTPRQKKNAYFGYLEVFLKKATGSGENGTELFGRLKLIWAASCCPIAERCICATSCCIFKGWQFLGWCISVLSIG